MSKPRTRVGVLRNLFTKSITIDCIAESLKTCNEQEDAEIVRSRMEENHYDVLGLKGKVDGKEVVIGYVEREKLKGGNCKDHYKPFGPYDIISASTPLMSVFSLMRERPERPWVFVLRDTEIDSIVTMADMHKQPVRMWFTSMLSLLEMNFLQLIQCRYYQNDCWREKLSEGRIRKAEERQKDREKLHEELDLLDCLQFGDKFDLLIQSDQARSDLSLGSKTRATDLRKKAKKLRDRLAHVHDLDEGTTRSEVFDLAQKIEKLVERCERVDASS